LTVAAASETVGRLSDANTQEQGGLACIAKQ
jgi:hypothetical protein